MRTGVQGQFRQGDENSSKKQKSRRAQTVLYFSDTGGSKDSPPSAPHHWQQKAFSLTSPSKSKAVADPALQQLLGRYRGFKYGSLMTRNISVPIMQEALGKNVFVEPSINMCLLLASYCCCNKGPRPGVRWPEQRTINTAADGALFLF